MNRLLRLTLANLSTVTVLLLTVCAPAQTRLYVDVRGPAAGDGSSWAKAFPNLTAALAKASSGAEVWVAEGRYLGGFDVPAGVTVVGGFLAGQTRRTQRRVDQHAVLLDGTDTQRVLVLRDGAVIDGVVVVAGRSAAPGGGGALILGTTGTLRNCTFLNNNIVAGRGSAVYAGNNGTSRATPILENCVFGGNGFATKLGHVIDFEAAGGSVRNILVANNNSNGLHLQNGSSTKIYNSVFAFNTGRGICHIDTATQPIVENCDFWQNTVGLYHFKGVDFQQIAQVNALPYAKNNLSADPRYNDPSKYDYTLASTSPLIDAGLELPGALALDRAGRPRIIDGLRTGTARIDIGPDEFTNFEIANAVLPIRGMNLFLNSIGRVGTPVIMAVGLDVSAAPVFLGGLGSLSIDLARPHVVVGWPSVGSSAVVAIPRNLPADTAVVFQGVAGTSTWGNLSNVLDLRIF
ncbi:MAG: right-handed parallel beta-helix repeat-containing protein [Planctomycetes bacterium]|nr:right-handed parallel beta-helix repeat-containing protein [Planctomycetota bacterium]